MQLKTWTYYVHIMVGRSLNLYTGITSSIYRRALQHKRGEVDEFTKKYNIDRLVYYEVFHDVGNAIAREKQIKSWMRAKRLALIKTRIRRGRTWLKDGARKSNCRSLGTPNEFRETHPACSG